MQTCLNRQLAPDAVGKEVVCGLCEQDTPLGIVNAHIVGPRSEDLGIACPSCITLLGRWMPDRFVTIEECQQAVREHPEPVFASLEELSRAEDAGTFDDAYWASWLDRAHS